jgi:transcriptional regulator with XRE-family HTH domain
MDIREVLAVNLRKVRQARGLSQEELAYRAEIDRTYISALERSVYAAGIDVVDRLGRRGSRPSDPSCQFGRKKKNSQSN